MLRPYIHFLRILLPNCGWRILTQSCVAPNHIPRKNGRYPRQIGYAPPPGDHSMSGWKDRGIPASACTGGRSGCVAMTIPVLARTSLPSVRALTFLGVCGPPK